MLTNLISISLRKKIGATLPNFKNNMFNDKIRKFKRLLLNSDSDLKKMQLNFLDQLSEEEHEGLFGIEKTNLEEEVFSDTINFDDPLNEILARDIKFSLSNDMLVKVDRFSMRHSLEVRSPFLDKDLANFSFRLPGRKKIGLMKLP